MKPITEAPQNIQEVFWSSGHTDTAREAMERLKSPSAAMAFVYAINAMNTQANANRSQLHLVVDNDLQHG